MYVLRLTENLQGSFAHFPCKASFRKLSEIQEIADLWGIFDQWLNVAEDGCICTGIGHSGATMR